MSHRDAEVVRTAARTLGRIATADAVDALKGALGKAPDNCRLAVADGCLGAAEALVVQGRRSQAAAMYQTVGKADLPKHFRTAAAHGALRARQPGGGR